MNRAPLLSTGIALAIGVAVAGIMACGGAMSAKHANMLPQSDAGGAPAAPRNQEITELDAKITDEFAKLGAGERKPALPIQHCEPEPCPTMSPMSVKPAADPACKPGPSTTCKDTCTLADSICDNAKKICEISKQLGNDAWATGKCADGETSCTTAHDRCCGCL